MTGILNTFIGVNSGKQPFLIGSVGSVANAATTPLAVAVTANRNIPSGSLLVLGICHDNVASATLPTVTVDNTTGTVWTTLGSNSSGTAAATAGSGIFLRVYSLLTTSAITSSSTITTVTFSSLVNNGSTKAINIWAFSNLTNTQRGTFATGVSTAGTPSAATAGTALVANDVVIGVVGGETNTLPTGDTDTLNGSWSTINGSFTTGGNAATNVTVGMQYKIVGGTAQQTYNPTTANDSVAAVFSLIPA